MGIKGVFATTPFQPLSHSSRSMFFALFLFSNHFSNVSKVPFQTGARRVVVLEEQKLTYVYTYARWRISQVRVQTQRKSAAQSQTEGGTPPQTEYSSLPSSHTCIHTFPDVQRPRETQQHNGETAN